MGPNAVVIATIECYYRLGREVEGKLEVFSERRTITIAPKCLKMGEVYTGGSRQEKMAD